MGAVKPKVMHVTTLHSTYDIRIFHKQCRTLAEAGYDVTLIAPGERNAVTDGVQVLVVPRIWNRLLRMTVSSWQAYRLARQQRADIYHFHDPELLPWMARLAKRATVIYDVHEDLAKSVRTKGWIPRALRETIARLSRRAEQRYSRRMQLVLAEQSYAQDYNWVPATVVLNMPRVDDLLAINELKHAQPTVAYLGTVNASRGTLVTLEALSKLKDEGQDVAFECMGPVSPAHQAELRSLAAARGIELNVPGYTPSVEGWHRVSRCQIGLALLKPLPNFVDSYPTKIFEYMALGLPIVASNLPLYRELVEGNGCGICVDPDDASAVAAAIRRLLSNPEEAQTMAQRGREAARSSYNWDTEAATLLSLYAQISAEMQLKRT
jgi:glycosyltransferase involved in cell wall biosynthesis